MVSESAPARSHTLGWLYFVPVCVAFLYVAGYRFPFVCMALRADNYARSGCGEHPSLHFRSHQVMTVCASTSNLSTYSFLTSVKMTLLRKALCSHLLKELFYIITVHIIYNDICIFTNFFVAFRCLIVLASHTFRMVIALAGM